MHCLTNSAVNQTWVKLEAQIRDFKMTSFSSHSNQLKTGTDLRNQMYNFH